MVVEYKYDKQSGIIYVYPGERLCFEDMRRYFQAIGSDETVKSGYVELVHFDQIKSFDMSADQAAQASELIKHMVDKKEEKAAVVIANTDLQYGMARMLSIILDDYFPVSIVRTKDEAMFEIDKLTSELNAI